MPHNRIIPMLLLLASCGQQQSSENNTSPNTPKTVTMEEINISDTVEMPEPPPPPPANATKNSETILDSGLPAGLRMFSQATQYRLQDTIRADFNGDGFADRAWFTKAPQASGIIILHGKTKETTRIGFGKPFAHLTDFDWVAYWGLVEDLETEETIFSEEGDVSGSRKITLQNPSIAIGNDDSGGGLITCLHGKYVWIHQAD